MLSNILSSLQDGVAGDLISKAGFSQDQIPGVMDVVGDVAKDKLGGELASGNIGSLMNLFSSKANTSAADGIQASLTSGIVTQLSSKLGIDSNMASTAATIIVPKLLDMITSKNNETPDTDTSFLTGMLGGDKSAMMDKAKDALGGFFKR
jgi:uncharacterized protein YidB (DUF937 family)